MDFCRRAFKIPRSIVAKGNLESLEVLESFLDPSLIHLDIPSGYDFNGWTVPNEWNLISASLITPQGEELINLNSSNLYVVVGSNSVESTLKLVDLLNHIHTRPDLPEAIPYVTMYYGDSWGICLPYSVVSRLSEGEYKVKILSSSPPGFMRLGEIFIEGKQKKEIFLSTYFCHPQMANNELSGPAVWMVLANHLWKKAMAGELNYSYRLYIGPETIGAIHYLNLRKQELVQNVQAGFVLTCVGVNSNLVFMPSRSGLTLADRVLEHILAEQKYERSNFKLRGSDERQWCSPAVNLPICSLMTKKYHDYPEYHTSLDNLEFISIEGFEKIISLYLSIIDLLEKNLTFLNENLGEPKLDSIGLYPIVNKDGNSSHLYVRNILNILNMLDGEIDTLMISETLGLDFDEVFTVLKILHTNGIISLCD